MNLRHLIGAFSAEISGRQHGPCSIQENGMMKIHYLLGMSILPSEQVTPLLLNFSPSPHA